MQHLVAGLNVERERVTDPDLDAIEDYKFFIQDQGKWPAATDHLTAATSDRERSASRFEYYMLFACGSLRAFATISGHVGMGSKITRDDDVVAILYGGRNPFVLRPYGEVYQHIGACNVYGAMDGEATREHRESGRPDITFSLRWIK